MSSHPSHLWLLNPTHSIKTLNLSPLIHSRILSSESFKALRDVHQWRDFIKYIKKASKGEENMPCLKFLEMSKNRQQNGPQMILFEWLMKMHMIWRDDMRNYAQGKDGTPPVHSLDEYVRYIHFEQYLAKNSSILWVEIALYCVWIRFMIDPQWQMDMYLALLDAQPRKMLSIPIFTKFDESVEVQKITMPILVDKLINHQRLFGAMLPRLPRRFQDDMRHQWRSEMRKRGISLKRKELTGDGKERQGRSDAAQDKEEEKKVEKVEITKEGRARFSKKPPTQKKDGFLDLSRYVSSQYGDSESNTGASSALNYQTKDTIQIGRPKKKRRIGL